MMATRRCLLWPVLMVAVMLGGGRAVACPQGCSCRHQRDLLSANCSSLPYSGGKVEALTLLPRDTPVELSDGQFNLAKHLKYLTLKNSSIYFVHKKAFYGAKKILEIDLSFNYIEDLDPTVFQHLINLTRLSLRGNPIHLEPEVPFLISNSLSHLDIGQCKIKSIPRGIFYELKRLTYLSLDGNYLKSVVYNSLPKGLKYLDLSNNHIVNVPTEVISALTNVGRLGLAGNPINCTCALMNFQDWLSGRGVIFEDDVICNSPSKYKGISWSKVDENMLCLAEAKREEMRYSSSSLMKNRLYKESYNDKHYYMEENVQSDQPGLVPDSDVEVFMKNDETIAMGEMMRDEEEARDEKEEMSENKDIATEDSDIKNPVQEKVEEMKPPTLNEIESEKDGDGSTDVQTLHQESVGDSEGITLSPKNESTQNINSENANLNTQVSISSNDTNKENIIEENVYSENPDESTGSKGNKSDSKSIQLDKTEKTETNEETKQEVGFQVSLLNQTEATPLNDSNPVEFETLNEEDQEVDEFKKEGLFHVVGSKYTLEQNSTSEESTAIPDVEEATEDEFSGQGPLIETDAKESYEDTADHNLTSTTEINNDTIIEEPVTSNEDEVVPPPVMIQPLDASIEEDKNVTEENTNVTESVVNITDPLIISHESPDNTQVSDTEIEKTESSRNTEVTQENEQVSVDKEPIETQENPKSEFESSGVTLKEKSQENKEEKVKEMAGAEVVMFCVAILVICLILYSIYKCRSSKNRQSRNMKDVESNRGTELQDMASLLPKSEEEKKNNIKYDDKAPPSEETVKLLTEQNENEPPNFTANPEAKSKIEDKNSINNNTPNSPSKTPLIKPEKPISINPASPIQRTKVRVGIIPDSIPRTPIFLQKTYNGTKKV